VHGARPSLDLLAARGQAQASAERGAIRSRRGANMSLLIGILITFLVVILVLWLVQRLPLDGRTRQIVQVIVIIIGIIALLRYLAVF
jgi:hypothetical protein